METKEIVMIGYAGLSEGLGLIREHREELRKRYSEAYLEEILKDEEILDRMDADRILDVIRLVEDLNSEASGNQARACETGNGEFMAQNADDGKEKIGTESAGETLTELTKGLYAGLWQLGEGHKSGLKTELSAIPVRQGTIEVCNELDLNPYEIPSPGSYLYATRKGYDLVLRLKEAGIPAALIGVTTREKARVICRGEERRYLEAPAHEGAQGS